MFKKITFLFWSTAVFMLLCFANTSAVTYDFGYTGGGANTYFGSSSYVFGNYWYTPYNYTILAINPGATPYAGNLTDNQIIRTASGSGYPMDASTVAPQNTYYPGCTVGVWNTTDYRVTSGSYNIIMQTYESSPYGSPMAWFTYTGGGQYGILYDQNGNGYGTYIYGGYYYGYLPMTTSSYYGAYYSYYQENVMIRYAPPVTVTSQIMTGSGTSVQSGSQTPALPAGLVWYNGSTGFTITAGGGQYITDIVVNDATHYGFQNSPYNLTLNNINSNWNLKIYFGYNIVLATGGTTINAIGYPAGFQYFPAGAVVSFNVAPQYPGSVITSLLIADRDNPSTSFTIPITNGGTGQVVTVGSNATSLQAPFNTPLSLNVKLTAYANIPINSSSGPHGQITNPGTLLYSYNSNTFFVMTPDPQYKFDQILIDGVNKLDVNGNPTDANLIIKSTAPVSGTYTFKNIISPRSIHVEYYAHKVNYVITGSGLGGSVNPPTPNPLRVNDNVTLFYQVTPLPDFKLSYLSWTDGTTTWNWGVPFPAHGGVDLTIPNVVNDLTISTSFTMATYTVTVKRHEWGQVVPYGNIDPVSGNGTIVVNSGVTKVFTITPDAGSHIVDVLVNGKSQGPITSYTMNTIRADATIEALFAKDLYHVYGVPGPNGSIFPNDTSVASGSMIDVVVTPDLGYKIATEMLNGVPKNLETEFQILNIKASQTVTATFEPTQIFTITATAGTGGKISPTGVVNVNQGLSQKFVITPDKGYMVLDVMVDNVSKGQITEFTFDKVSDNHTIDVTFEMIPVPVVECTINSTPVISGIPFSMTIKLKDQNTGNPYPSPVDIPVTVTTTGTGVLGGVTTGTILKTTSEITIDNITYTNDNGEINVQFSAGVQGYKACTGTTTVMAKEPALQDKDILGANITTDGINLTWTAGDGAKRLGLIKPKTAIDATELPADGTNYSADPNYMTGQLMGTNGCYVIYGGVATSVKVTGLTLGETYYVKICSYNGDGPTANYNTSDGVSGNPSSFLIQGVNDNPVSLAGFEIKDIAPNPVINNLHFTLSTSKILPVTIELLDMSGKMVVTAYDNKTFNTGNTDINIPVNNLSAGVYLVKVLSGNDFAFRTFTIVR